MMNKLRILRRAATLLTAAVALGACGDRSDSAPAPSQVAAKVNKTEITVHQINGALARVGAAAVSQEQAKAASVQVLEQLIDQELLVQQAREKKIDRKAEVVLALESARRQVLAQAFMEEVTGNSARPAADAVKGFYAEHPDLFAQRRIYRLRELSIAARDEDAKRVHALGEKVRTLTELAAGLKAQSIAFTEAVTTKPAEQITLQYLPKLSRLKDNEFVLIPAGNGLLAVQVLESQLSTVSEKEATPFIDQYLMNQEKVRTAQAEIKRLRVQARIEYVGEFQATAAQAMAQQADATTPGMDRGVRSLK
jgi:EpsD family peptidyl-prolyl cis-trans isomerase